MKIRSIVNKDVATITSCKIELIHIPGSIQPHGFLLGAGLKNLEISYCSENSIDFIGKTYAELLGANLKEIFDPVDIEKMRKQFAIPLKNWSAPSHLAMAQKH